MRVAAEHLDQVLHPQFAGKGKVIAKGLAASPGAAVGKVYFTADDAVDADERGEKVILVRNETSPEDVHGMMVSQGILTARGGLVSHAAVVARGWGTPAIVGADIGEDRRASSSPSATSRSARATSISPRRHDRRGRARRDEAGGRRAADRVHDDPRVGRQVRKGKLGRPRQRRHRRGRDQRSRARAPRASACAAPSTCSWRPTGCRSCAR